MSATSITLSAPSNPELRWFDSFKDLTNKELNEIAIHCRTATAALFTELSDRRHTWKDQKLEDYQHALLKNANQINEEGLTNEHELYLNQLCTFLADPDDAQTERSEIKIVRQYLWLVSRVVGWSYALLILYTLGKHKLQKLDEDRRIKLAKHIVQNRDSLSCPRLEEKATRCNLCQIHVKADLPLTRGSRERKREMELEANNQQSTTNSKRKAQDLHEDPSQKRPRLLPVPNGPSLHDSSQYGPRANSSQPQMINLKQRPFLPTPESSQEHISTRDQATGPTQVLQIQPSPLPTPPPCENASLPGPSLEFSDKIRTVVLKRNFDDSTYLLLLAYALGSSLPESLVLRTQSAQLRWSNDGTEQKVTAFEAGLDSQLLEILSTENRLSEALTFFDKLPDASQPWTITPDIQAQLPKILTEQEKEKWSIEALNWVCFAFPRIRHRELQYTSLVRSLLPLLNHALQEVERSNIPNFLKHEVSEALLAASKIEGIRRDVLSKVANFADKESPLYLQAELALEKSILSRLGGDFNDSERAIHDFCCRCETSNDKCIPRFFQQGRPARVKSRLSTMHGLLHRSHLENLVQCEKYDLAKQQVNDWEMPPAPSPMDWSILPSRTVTSSKVFRSQGDFTAARERLEMCLKILKGHEQVGSQVLCQLLDIYADLELPQLAAELIAPEIEKWRKKAPKSKALRRILVSSIDINLQREHYHDANKIIEELSSTFEGLQNLDVSDELLHIRLLIASARINYLCSEFGQAVQRWKVALDHVQKYASFNGEGFTYAVIHLSISLAHLEIDENEEAAISFDHGQRILRGGMRDYWIPTLPAWFRYVASKMQSMAGWVC